MSTVTACLTIHNEEDVIRRCLESLDGVVDEIVVVHGGKCHDSTLEICEEYTTKIHVVPDKGLCDPDRVVAFEEATSDWILQIDADEYLSNDLREQIPSLIERADVDLYSFLWPYTDGDQMLTAGLGYPYRPCLARKSKLVFIGLPHEPLRTRGETERVPLILRHEPGYDNYTFSSFRKKWVPWAEIHAEWLLRTPEEIPVFGVKGTEKVEELMNQHTRWPLVKGILSSVRTFGWHLYKGLWKTGPRGMRVALLQSAYQLILHYRVQVMKR